MREKLIVANWKMNPDTPTQALRLFEAVAKEQRQRGVKVVVCPPFPYVARIAHHASKKLKGSVMLGAQNTFWEPEGPYTGEVSPRILKNVGVKYVILGHSERRRFLGETDEMIAKKVRASLHAGLHAILCVGEPLKVRRRGITAARRFVRSQLEGCLKSALGTRAPHVRRIIVAYEPVWAISTATGHKDESPEDAAEMIAYIKELLRKRGLTTPFVLYGGSVHSKNAKEFLAHPEIDGALVGGASLRAREFVGIIRVASQGRGA